MRATKSKRPQKRSQQPQRTRQPPCPSPFPSSAPSLALHHIVNSHLGRIGQFLRGNRHRRAVPLHRPGRIVKHGQLGDNHSRDHRLRNTTLVHRYALFTLFSRTVTPPLKYCTTLTVIPLFANAVTKRLQSPSLTQATPLFSRSLIFPSIAQAVA